MKISSILVALMAFVLSVHAQEEGTFRGSVELGYAIPSAGGGGISYTFEPQYNIKDNMNIGVRFQSAALLKEISSNGESFESEVAAVSTWFVTYNYYFNDGSSAFAPFVGGGLGLAVIGAPEIIVNGNRLDFESGTTFGGVLRGGFEWKKLIVGLEYNLIPKSSYDQVTTSTGTLEADAESKNGYFGVNIGFFLGGSKWGG